MSGAAFGKLLEELFKANGVNIALTTDETFVHDGGAVVYQIGHFEETFTPKDGTAPATTRANFLARWKRAAAGGSSLDRMVVAPMPAKASAAR
jgi:ketosteroid isomerase-like protein